MENELIVLRTFSDEGIREYFDDNSKIKTFNRLLENNRIDEAKKMYSIFGRSLYNDKTLSIVLDHNTTDDVLFTTIAWLRSKFTISLNEAISAMLACSMKAKTGIIYLGVMSYLKQEFNLTKSILGMTYIIMLSQAVSMTNLKTIKWLHEKYTITRDEMKTHEITVLNSFEREFRGWIVKNILSESNSPTRASFCITCGSTTNIVEMGRCFWCEVNKKSSPRDVSRVAVQEYTQDVTVSPPRVHTEDALRVGELGRGYTNIRICPSCNERRVIQLSGTCLDCEFSPSRARVSACPPAGEFEFNGIERHVQSQENYRLTDRNVKIQKQDTTASTFNTDKDVPEQITKTSTDNECKICMNAEVNCAIVECGHMCACYTCAIQLDICPICRAKITRVIRVYSS